MQNRADKRKYHFIYKTTNQITGKFYIGMHSTDNLEDGYVGSGKRLWYSINKYGKENHRFEILEFVNDRKSLANREAEIVNEEFLLTPLCLNLKIGGSGGWPNPKNNPEWMKEHIAFIKKRFAECMEDESFYNDFCAKIKKAQSNKDLRIMMSASRSKDKNYNAFWIGKKHSQDSKNKIAKSMIDKQDGNKNSQFGTCWIYHELVGNKKCKINVLPEFIEQGWIKGRKNNASSVGQCLAF
jgi:hypothetical protein